MKKRVILLCLLLVTLLIPVSVSLAQSETSVCEVLNLTETYTKIPREIVRTVDVTENSSILIWVEYFNTSRDGDITVTILDSNGNVIVSVERINQAFVDAYFDAPDVITVIIQVDNVRDNDSYLEVEYATNCPPILNTGS